MDRIPIPYSDGRNPWNVPFPNGFTKPSAVHPRLDPPENERICVSRSTFHVPLPRKELKRSSLSKGWCIVRTAESLPETEIRIPHVPDVEGPGKSWKLARSPSPFPPDAPTKPGFESLPSGISPLRTLLPAISWWSVIWWTSKGTPLLRIPFQAGKTASRRLGSYFSGSNLDILVPCRPRPPISPF